MQSRESSSRGYVISGDRGFLDHAGAELLAYEQNLAVARELVRDSPAQAKRMSELDALARGKLEFVAANVALRDEGDTVVVARRVAGRHGKQLMDELRRKSAEMEVAERHDLERLSATAARTERDGVLAVGATALAILLLLAQSVVRARRDATELLHTSEELRRSEESYRVLIEHSGDLVRLHGADGHPFFVSPSAKHLLDYSPAECVAAAPYALVHPEDAGTAKYMLGRLQSGELRGGSVTYRLRRRDGEYRWFEFNMTRVDAADGSFRHYQSSGRDVTVRRRLEQRLAEQTEALRNLSLRDGLTGLYNRRGLLELSAQVVRVAEREQHSLLVLFADLDGLKAINDRLGHEQGDCAIREAAEILRATCRATDIVARLGGDEFVVLASNVDEAGIEILKQRLGRAVEEANDTPARSFPFAFSLGVARYDPTGPLPIETLIAEADARMYEAKVARRRGEGRDSRPLTGAV